MEEELYQNLPISYASSTSIDGGVHSRSEPSSSSSFSSSQVQVEEEEEEEENHHQDQEQEQQQQQQQTNITFISNVSNPFVNSPGSSDDAWSCVVVLLTFWFFASMTLILGLYGSTDLQLGPNSSHLLQASSLLVNEIKVEKISGPKYGLMLYGFNSPPSLDVEMNWSETHKESLLSNSHKEWIFYLNKGSELDIGYSVKSQSSSPISLVIARGKESFIEWIEDPSYPNLTSSWNIIYGSGMIQQKILESSDYYVAVGNLNPEEVEVQLNFRVRAVLYNTTQAYYKCSLAHGVCSLRLFFLGTNAAVLTSTGPEKDGSTDNWYVKLWYEPRWISYFVGSGTMTVIILLALRLCNKFQSTTQNAIGFQAANGGSERAPLLAHKDDDTLSWGSSYDSVSHDEEDPEDFLGVDTKSAVKDGDNHPRRLCVICFDDPRDCFFLPCGHCAACFTCGTRIVEEAGTCPICRRKMKKVRKIFSV